MQFLSGVNAIGTRSDGIVLATKRNNLIRNSLGLPPSDSQAAEIALQHGRWLGRAGYQERSTPQFGYNCAGHVWGARRCVIDEDPSWHQILAEDGYRFFEDERELVVGDLVVYKIEKSDLVSFQFLHVGVVIDFVIQQMPAARGGRLALERQRKPRLLSKLDAWSGEFIHMMDDVIFGAAFPDHYREYWTDRPVRPVAPVPQVGVLLP